MTRRLPLALLCAGAALGLPACGADTSVPADAHAHPPADTGMAGMDMGGGGTGAPGARVTFVRTATAAPGTIDVRVRLHHFVIDPAAVGMSPRPNHGHLHFTLAGGRYDDARYSGPQGRLAAKLGVAGKYSPSLTPAITYRHIPAGRYTLRVDLANNNHTLTGVGATTHVVVR
jgi:hypothetical protein